jgi:hypothetical protein
MVIITRFVGEGHSDLYNNLFFRLLNNHLEVFIEIRSTKMQAIVTQ